MVIHLQHDFFPLVLLHPMYLFGISYLVEENHLLYRLKGRIFEKEWCLFHCHGWIPGCDWSTSCSSF